MHPELFTIPIIGVPVKMYGFCMMVGFLSAVWLSMRRATRVKADPDIVLDISFLSLIFGVTGARVFYVIHYWQSDFADAPNRLIAAIDITGGGLEFLGGLLGALVAVLIYAWRKRFSLRLYLDIVAPSVMWGLAFGRLGCFFNGCCFGAMCAVPQTMEPAKPWAVAFPFGSQAHYLQWEERRVTVPAELITTAPLLLWPRLLPADNLAMSVEKRESPLRDFNLIKKQYERVLAEAPDAEETAMLKTSAEAARKRASEHDSKLISLRLAKQYPSRKVPTRGTSVSELESLAAAHASVPVHPTQLYSSLNAMLISGVLSAFFYYRKRHGAVIGLMFIMYPVPRALLELIRVDNPYDVGGLTISQFVSISMLIGGSVYLWLLYKRMPERSLALE